MAYSIVCVYFKHLWSHANDSTLSHHTTIIHLHLHYHLFLSAQKKLQRIQKPHSMIENGKAANVLAAFLYIYFTSSKSRSISSSFSSNTFKAFSTGVRSVISTPACFNTSIG